MKHILFLLSFIFICLSSIAQTQLWSTTSSGGLYSNGGTIFKMDSSGNNHSIEKDFVVNDCKNPTYTELLEMNDGSFYGMSKFGGVWNSGVIFQYNPITNIYTKKINFDLTKGTYPEASLIQAIDGKLYGMTSQGGTNNEGVLFQYDPITNVYAKKLDFSNSLMGRFPLGSLIQASDGNLYGLTSAGGNNGAGVLFQYNPVADVYTKKIDFNFTNGQSPSGTLLQANDGMLYGLTKVGGTNNYGVLFQYNINTNSLIVKVNFTGGVNGNNPFGSLIQASDNMLYGFTEFGGTDGTGVLFQYNLSSNTFTKKSDFSVINGRSPKGQLIQANDGNLYGLAPQSGTNNNGVLFQYNLISEVLVPKINFSNQINGSFPQGSLMQASDGKLYGMTNSSNINSIGNDGTIFQYNVTSNSLVNKLVFGLATNGAMPITNLLKLNDGKLLGVTQVRGINNEGVLYEYNPSIKSYTKKIDFSSVVTGKFPSGALIQASNGKIYGVATDGGIYANGVLFEYDKIANTLIKKVDFSSLIGRSPEGSLVEASDGNLYGTTRNGGVNDKGVLFQYDPITNAYLKKYDFSGIIDGELPNGGLIQASDGNLYGLTQSGGANNFGVLFQYNLSNNTYTKLIDFSGSLNGAKPLSSLIQASDGYIYGMTRNGGINDFGVIFRYDILSNTFTKRFDFVGASTGYYPAGSLFETSNGDIYGMTSFGGVNSKGVIFKYDKTANLYLKKFDFSTIDGYLPQRASFIELSLGINTGTVASTFCAGDSVLIPFNAEGGYNSGNAQLSDEFGSFASPISIGNTSNKNVINSRIPLNAVSGIGYNVRVVSSSPAIIGTINSGGIVIDNTCSYIWPGDANSDGLANNLDVLELGLHYTQTGAPRASVSNNWQSYFANNWIGTISNGSNLNHSDCNGDGLINDDDTLAIYNNYGLTHTFKPAQTTTVNPQLNIVPDQSMVVKGMWGTASIYLGDATNTIANINGIAFTVDFDQTLIEPSNVWLEYQNSFMDASQNLYFRKLDFANSKLFTASTHTVSNNVSGFGKIATLHYQILSSLATDQVLNIGLSQANQSNATGIITPLTTGTGTLMAIGTSVGVKEVLMSGNVLISPNPTNGLLNINFSTMPQNTKIEIYNGIGALVFTETMSNKNNIINVSELSSGMYFMKVLEGNKVVALKKVVKE